MHLYSLYEHSTGYALLKIDNIEEIGALLPMVQNSTADYGTFAGNVKLSAFTPFSSGINALENMNAISEGSIHDDLRVFLENNLPKKMSKVTLGVQDPKMAQALNELFPDLKLSSGEAFTEVSRATRQFFAKMQKGMTAEVQSTAQRGLAHSYSRAKLRFNVHRQDNMIIQAIAMIDQLDKNINTFAMRVREWYSYHFPEMIKIVNENIIYCKLICLIGKRDNLLKAVLDHEDAQKADPDNDELAQPELITKMEELLMDSAKTQAVCDSSRRSVGMGISDIDLMNVEHFAKEVVNLANFRRELQEYLRSKMANVAPNLAALIGDVVGARLISHAGSLTNLAKYPASTVQILGAEKALFRALKKRGNTPKYGLIFHSTFIGRAAAKNKGRISRFLANKASIACRMDCFSDADPNPTIGNYLKQQVEDRLKFYESGVVPEKNIDVMKRAVAELNSGTKMDDIEDDIPEESTKDDEEIRKAKKAAKKAKKEKKKKRKAEASTADDSSTEEPVSKKSKETKSEESVEMETEETSPKKKSKKKSKKKLKKSTAQEA